MRIIKAIQHSACAAMLCATLGTGASADTWNKKTIVTFADSVEIPGQVLSAGTYVFKLANNIADRNIVEIWLGDETRLLALLTVPDYRPDSPNKTTFEFAERPADSLMAVRAWLYPGEKTGREFVYPHS
jgi:hypothetical protein